MCEENKENVAFSSAFYDPSSDDCKQTKSMQTRVFLKLGKKCCIKLLRAKHLQVKGMIDNRCHALEAVPERRAIHKLNAYFFVQKIKSECKYKQYYYNGLKGMYKETSNVHDVE